MSALLAVSAVALMAVALNSGSLLAWYAAPVLLAGALVCAGRGST